MIPQKNKKIKCIIAFVILLLTVFTVSVNAASANEFPVSFKVDVSSELNEYYNYIYISVQNKETYDLYDFNVYRKDGWVASVNLPAGKYSIVAGGILNDWENNYPIERKFFEVSETSSKSVKLKCGNVETPTDASTPTNNNSDISVSDHKNNNPNPLSAQTTNLISTDSDNDASYNKIINVIPIIIVVIALIYYFYRKKKNNETE